MPNEGVPLQGVVTESSGTVESSVAKSPVSIQVSSLALWRTYVRNVAHFLMIEIQNDKGVRDIKFRFCYCKLREELISHPFIHLLSLRNLRNF